MITLYSYRKEEQLWETLKTIFTCVLLHTLPLSSSKYGL